MVHSFLLKTAALVSSTLLASTLLINPGAADGNKDTVTLTHPSSSKAVISLFGAQVISFRAAHDPNLELLFMSKQSGSDGVKRGGISIEFPNAGHEHGSSVPAYGFARTIKWAFGALVPAADVSTYTYAVFDFLDSEATHQMWPYSFGLMYEVRLSAFSLDCTFHVITKHDTVIKFDVLLQNHLYVPSVVDNGLVISGLQNVNYYDHVTKMNQTDSRGSFGITSQVDSVYKNVETNVTAYVRGGSFNQNVVIQSSAELTDGAHRPLIYHPDRDISNPWKEGSMAAGFSDDEYLHMVAIGSGRVVEQQAVYPGLRFIQRQTIYVDKL